MNKHLSCPFQMFFSTAAVLHGTLQWWLLLQWWGGDVSDGTIPSVPEEMPGLFEQQFYFTYFRKCERRFIV